MVLLRYYISSIIFQRFESKLLMKNMNLTILDRYIFKINFRLKSGQILVKWNPDRILKPYIRPEPDSAGYQVGSSLSVFIFCSLRYLVFSCHCPELHLPPPSRIVQIRPAVLPNEAYRQKKAHRQTERRTDSHFDFICMIHQWTMCRWPFYVMF